MRTRHGIVFALLLILLFSFAVEGGKVKILKTSARWNQLLESCVCQFKMNDNAANTIVLDSVGDYNGVAQQNTEDINAIGKIDGALSFNGMTDCIDTGQTFQSTFQNDFAISCWVNRSVGGNENRYYFFTLTAIGGTVLIDIDASSGEIDFGYYSFYPEYGKMINTDDLSVIGQWQHIVCVAEQTSPTATTLRIYLNGVLVREESVELIMADYSSSNNLFLGGVEVAGSFYGSLDNVCIFNKAISQAEIDFLYNNGQGRE